MKIKVLNEAFIPSVKIGNSMGPEDYIFENDDITSYIVVNSRYYTDSYPGYKEIFNVVYVNQRYDPALKFSVSVHKDNRYYMEIDSPVVNRKRVCAWYDDPDLDVTSVANRIANEIFKPITVWDDEKSIAYVKKITSKARKAFADADSVEVA